LARIEIFGEKRQRGSDPQNNGKKMGKFTGEAEKKVFATYFLDMVRTELRQSARGLDRSKTGNCCLQAGERLLDTEVVNFQWVKGSLVVQY